MLQGKLPEQVEKITDPDIKEFVLLCLSPPEKRPSAAELLALPFFKDEEQGAVLEFGGIF